MISWGGLLDEKLTKSNAEPLPTKGQEVVYEKVLDVISEQVNKGYDKYGTYLETFNGRKSLVDAQQEAVDQLMYITQSRMQVEKILEYLYEPDTEFWFDDSNMWSHLVKIRKMVEQL